jgi:hypothetical protein
VKSTLKFAILVATTALYACERSPSAEEILEKSIVAHGGDAWETASFSFDFRDKSYSIQRQADQYTYTRSFSDSTGRVLDSLVNSVDFIRYINDTAVQLTEEWVGKYSNSVNSVLYFVQIPYILRDPAVCLELVGSAYIGESSYYTLKVTFAQEGGGEDFEDEYRYWVDTENYTVDFLAYNYQTEGGGTRFREAINRRNVGELLIQDYINYAPKEKFPPLDSLPGMWENDQLQEVSRIINTDVRIIDTE